MKAFITMVLTLTLVTGLFGCTTRGNNDNSSSSSLPSSSVAPSSSSPAASSTPSMSEPHPISDLEEEIKDTVSNVESAVSPTMSTDFDKIGALGASQVKWGSGLARDPETNRTTDAEGLQDTYAKYGAYFIAPKGTGKFYLTFDEGYENGNTAVILDILKERGLSAVFFVTGDYVLTQPELVRRMIDEGHVVGNHTNKHKNPTLVSLEEAKADIQVLHDYMLEHFGYEMWLYRPPEGAFSEQTLAMVQQMGYTTVLWSFGYNDWSQDNPPGEQKALETTTKFIHEGAIYLLHAVSKDNSAVLPTLLDEIEGKGLKISRFDLPYVPPAE